MQLYSKDNLFDNPSVKIENFNLGSFMDFIKNKTLLSLEAISTILYLFDEDVGENVCVSSIHNLKNHISADIIRDAYISVKTFDLFKKRNIGFYEEDIIQKQVLSKIKELTLYFEKFEDSTNRIIIWEVWII